MAEPLYVITGATGHVGSIITNALLEQRKRVRVVARHANALEVFSRKGAELAVGSLEDADFVQRALHGAHAAFLMVPPNFQTQSFRAYQRQVVDNEVAAVVAHRVSYVATLSSVGAHLPEGTGPVKGLYELEQKLNKTNANVLHIRPTYFLENHLNSIGAVKQMGKLPGALKGDLPIAQIATRDIGTVAARRLAALDFSAKQVLELLGARDVSMNEVAKVFGQAIGKQDLSYLELPYDEVKKSLVGMGITEELAGMYMEMTRGFNEGKIKPTQPRSKETTTPTTVEDFARSAFQEAFKRS